MVVAAGLTRVAPRCKWASEYRFGTPSPLPAYPATCARNRFAFLRPPRGSPFSPFSLYTYHAVVFHRRRTLLKFRFSRLRPTLHPLPLQFASKARPFSFFLTLPRSLCSSPAFHTDRRASFFYSDSDLYIPFYIYKKRDREQTCRYRALNSRLFDY